MSYELGKEKKKMSKCSVNRTLGACNQMYQQDDQWEGTSYQLPSVWSIQNQQPSNMNTL